MSYTVTDKLMIAALIAQFLLIVIGGTFSAHAVGVWLTNRREERSIAKDERLAAAQRRADHDRQQWMELVKMRDNTISEQTPKMAVLERRLERMEDLLKASEDERRKMMGVAEK